MMATEQDATEVVEIAKLERSPHEQIRVEICGPKGRQSVNARTWVFDAEGDKWEPRRGLTLSAGDAWTVGRAMQAAAEKAGV